MLNTVEEIQKNGIVNHFRDVANNYGISGFYALWKPGGLNHGGVYFVCGFDNNVIESKSVDMFTIIDRQRRNRDQLYTDATAFKISGEHPFMLHCKLMDHLHGLNAVKTCYQDAKKPVPTMISRAIVEAMEVAVDNYKRDKKDPNGVLQYKQVVRRLIEQAEEYNNPSNCRKKNAYKASPFYDSGRGKVYNFFKRIFKKYKNEVSPQHLIAHAGRVCSAKVTLKNYKEIKNELKKCPHILYNFSEIQGGVFNLQHWDAPHLNKVDDRRYYMLYFPYYCSKDVEEILQKINYPTEFNYSIDDIDPDGAGTEHCVIPIKYYNMLKTYCDEIGVKFCIDKTALDTVADGVAIAFSTKNSMAIYSSLTGIMAASESYRLDQKENCSCQIGDKEQNQQLHKGEGPQKYDSKSSFIDKPKTNPLCGER